jgi:hypothetical protein
MKKLLFISAFLVLTGSIYSQNTPTSIKQPTDASTIIKKTLTINTSGLSLKTVEGLKAELINWKEKVIAIDIDQPNHLFILKHNGFMNERELFEVLDKYGITKTSITSYQ